MYNSCDSYNTCKSCGKDFKKISLHWASSDCRYPKLDKDTESVIKGLLAGDATIGKDGRLSVYTTNPIFAEFIYRQLISIVPVTVSIRDADSNELMKRELFELTLPKHKFTKKLRDDWYNPKKIPKNTVVDKLFTKYWYVCDGNLNSKYEASITTSSKNIEFVEKSFNQLPFEYKIKNIGTTELSNNDRYRIYISSRENVEKFLNYLGEPVPGFEYKWEIDGNKRKSMKQDVYQKI